MVGKKVLTVLLASSMILGAVPAAFAEEASGDGLTTENITLTFWKSPHANEETDYWQEIIDQWKELHPNIDVEFLSVAWDEVITKETAAFAAGEAPDITFQTENFPVYAKSGYLLSLEDYVTDEKKAGYTQSALDYCSNDGVLMGIPFIALNSVMFYNKTLFEEAGVEIPTTWDEMEQAALALTKDKDGDGQTDQWGLLYMPAYDYWQVIALCIQAGGDLWNEARTNIGFNDEAGITGLSFYDKLVNEDGVTVPVGMFASEDEGLSYFYNGQVAMYPNQIQNANTIRNNSDVDLGAFLVPFGPAEDPEHSEYNYANIGMLSVSADSKYPAEAAAFVLFATQPEIESQYLSKVGFFSPQFESNSLMYENDEVMAVAAEDIEKLVVSPASDYTNIFYELSHDLGQSIALGMATPEEALATMESGIYALSGEHGD